MTRASRKQSTRSFSISLIVRIWTRTRERKKIVEISEIQKSCASVFIAEMNDLTWTICFLCAFQNDRYLFLLFIWFSRRALLLMLQNWYSTLFIVITSYLNNLRNFYLMIVAMLQYISSLLLNKRLLLMLILQIWKCLKNSSSS